MCDEAADDTQRQQLPTSRYQTFGSTSSHSSSGDDGTVPVDVQ